MVKVESVLFQNGGEIEFLRAWPSLNTTTPVYKDMRTEANMAWHNMYACPFPTKVRLYFHIPIAHNTDPLRRSSVSVWPPPNSCTQMPPCIFLAPRLVLCLWFCV